jgi:hypothetical protein
MLVRDGLIVEARYGRTTARSRSPPMRTAVGPLILMRGAPRLHYGGRVTYTNFLLG